MTDFPGFLIVHPKSENDFCFISLSQPLFCSNPLFSLGSFPVSYSDEHSEALQCRVLDAVRRNRLILASKFSSFLRLFWQVALVQGH